MNEIPFPENKIYAVFYDNHRGTHLAGYCMDLLSQQRKEWHTLEQSYNSLENVEIREITCNGFSVRAQRNPGRITSTTANVGAQHIDKRPCFLCPTNLPDAQKGIPYRNQYVILCNPMPVFAGHFTIASCEHQPQTIVPHIDELIRIMNDFGQGWTILYNGPGCGASAPDHLHFQAIPSGMLPVEKEITDKKRPADVIHANGVVLERMSGLGREVIIISGSEPARIAVSVKEFVAALKTVTGTDDEPMMSIIGFSDGEYQRIVIFPRAKHRPDVFYKKGDERIVVSPAVIEMAGVLVTPMEKDFLTLSASVAESIYEEVSLRGPVVDQVFGYMKTGN